MEQETIDRMITCMTDIGPACGACDGNGPDGSGLWGYGDWGVGAPRFFAQCGTCGEVESFPSQSGEAAGNARAYRWSHEASRVTGDETSHYGGE